MAWVCGMGVAGPDGLGCVAWAWQGLMAWECGMGVAGPDGLGVWHGRGRA